MLAVICVLICAFCFVGGFLPRSKAELDRENARIEAARQRARNRRPAPPLSPAAQNTINATSGCFVYVTAAVGIGLVISVLLSHVLVIVR